AHCRHRLAMSACVTQLGCNKSALACCEAKLEKATRHRVNIWTGKPATAEWPHWTASMRDASNLIKGHLICHGHSKQCASVNICSAEEVGLPLVVSGQCVLFVVACRHRRERTLLKSA